jgi:hypothetical protein
MPSPPVRVIKGSSAHKTREVHVLGSGPKEMNLGGHHYKGEQQGEGTQRNPRYHNCWGRKFRQSVLHVCAEPSLRCGATESREISWTLLGQPAHNGTYGWVRVGCFGDERKAKAGRMHAPWARPFPHDLVAGQAPLR